MATHSPRPAHSAHSEDTGDAGAARTQTQTHTHTYAVSCRWSGSTGAGYDRYDRGHDVACPPAATSLSLSSDPAFLGDAKRLNPEQLLVAAAASCQMLSFLAVAARSRLDVVGYEDDAIGFMPDAPRHMAITRIELRPTISVSAGIDGAPVDRARIAHLCEVAHRECFIANSLKTEITVTPTINLVDAPAG